MPRPVPCENCRYVLDSNPFRCNVYKLTKVQPDISNATALRPATDAILSR